MQETRQEPRHIAIHRSLNRPHLLLGAERGLVLLTGVVTAMLAITFWTCSFWALVRMGKADPQMSRVYQRHVRYRSYYAAHSCIEAMLPGGGMPKA
jgi:type IV secretory pathway TrbD component